MKMILTVLLAFSSYSMAQETPAETTTTNQTTQTVESTEKSVADATVTTTQTTSTTSVTKEKPRFEHIAYGYFAATRRETFKTVQNLEPIEKNELDFAELSFEGKYHLTPTSEIEFEVEFEHGGVGLAMEYDMLEEFGEFEQEIEKGGEVVVSELVYKKKFANDLSMKVGRFPVFISLGSVIGKPARNSSVLVSDLEGRMIPYGWKESGLQLEQKVGPETIRLGMVTGLNSEFFRTYSWVGGGYQRHFETSNSGDMAMIANLEWGSISKGHGVGLSYYQGNTTGNRYKVDKFKDDANVSIWNFMANYKYEGFGLMGQYMVGELENSDTLAAANKTLGGLAKPKTFSNLGAKAELQTVQASYDFNPEFTFYLKHEHVNTFAEIKGNVAKDPRYDVTRNGGGFMWMWDTAMFMKFQYAREKTELVGLPETYQATVAFGFDLDKFN
jgi:hypothetical protein